MKDIHEVLRRKQAKYAQLQKQIEALQQAADKLREVAPLLTDGDQDDTVVLAETEEETQQPMSRAAAATNQTAPPKPANRAPRWP
jgi:hypothetical protein